MTSQDFKANEMANLDNCNDTCVFNVFRERLTRSVPFNSHDPMKQVLLSHFREESTKAQKGSSPSKLVTKLRCACLLMQCFKTRHGAIFHAVPEGCLERSGFLLNLH